MNNTFFIYKAPYHTDKFNKIIHIDPFVYEVYRNGTCGYKATHIHRIKDGKFITRKASKEFILVSQGTLEDRLFDDLENVRYQGYLVGGGTWLVCSQLGLAWYKKLLLLRKAHDRVCDNIEIITFRHPTTLLPKYKDNFEECLPYINILKEMDLENLLEKTKIEFPECFI